MRKIMGTVKEIVQAAAAAFDTPPESFAVVDEYGNEWTYALERTCRWKPADFITEGEWWNTECGESFTWEPDGTPDYCPSCGAKVEVD